MRPPMGSTLFPSSAFSRRQLALPPEDLSIESIGRISCSIAFSLRLPPLRGMPTAPCRRWSLRMMPW